ncbi:hypothetical protein [Denitrobacterium detoxificans]|jgi:hypothetical protein|uniref:hypothetical protein n=1 Tax=Denitrobacterium detoxificans TaxID=79604 RepID=UPI0026EEBD48|nr:hypothetical protein [Denitrobacterium detoxificans]MBE6466389.1 hypothetical protein [Denitrobacterium detoxificans]
MSSFSEAIKRETRSLIPEIQQRFRNERDAEIQEAIEAERVNNIAMTAIAMLDAGLRDELVTHTLQKYWDLWLSKASDIIEWAHFQLNESVEP